MGPALFEVVTLLEGEEASKLPETTCKNTCCMCVPFMSAAWRVASSSLILDHCDQREYRDCTALWIALLPQLPVLLKLTAYRPARSGPSRLSFGMRASGEADGEAEKAKRPRGGHEKAEDLTAILGKYFNNPLKVKGYKGKLDHKSLCEHSKLLMSLFDLQPNLSFVPLVLKSALKEVAMQKAAVWKFSDSDAEQFACDVGPRLRAMCRHLSQAMRKPKTPAWVTTVLGAHAQLTLGEVGLCA